MVEYTFRLDAVFGSLADATRRDMLRRVFRQELSVNQIAEVYSISLAAVSKHLKILEDAQLIQKRKVGKQRLVRATPAGMKDAVEYLHYYEALWGEQLDPKD